MGRIFERFGNNQYHNEDEVSERLVVPLFTDFLGYSEHDILPQHLLPTVKIPRKRETQALLIIADPRQPILIPAIDARPRVLVGEKIPRRTIWTVILAHGSPGAFRKEWSPLFPIDFTLFGLMQTMVFVCSFVFHIILSLSLRGGRLSRRSNLLLLESIL